MTIHPSSNVTLYIGIPFSPTYQHTMYFKNLGEQISFFSNWTNKHEFTQYSYVRDERRLKVQPVSQSRSMWSYNYISFNNPDGSRFYGFITDIDYIANNTYAISFEIDYFQTFFPLLSMGQCYVDREHVPSDLKGEHTEAEPFGALGQMVYECAMSPTVGDPNVPEYPSAIESFNSAHGLIVFATTFNMREELKDVEGLPLIKASKTSSVTNNVYSGLQYTGYAIDNTANWKLLIDTLTSKNLLDGIISIFMCNDGIFLQAILGGDDHGTDFYVDINNSNLGAYTPKNNKLYTYPYNFAYVTNNEGNSATLKFEYFDAYQQNFGRLFMCMGSVLNCNPIMGLFPRNYAGILYNYNEMLTTSSFPQCAWQSDTFKAYIAQNTGRILASAVESGVSLVSSAAQIGIGAAQAIGGYFSGNEAGDALMGKGRKGMLSGVSGIANTMTGVLESAGQMYDVMTMPPQLHGNDTSTLNNALLVKGFEIFRVHVNSETARIIDDWFTMFGYHVGRVKYPEMDSRNNFNYIKTVGCNVSGGAPAYAIARINAIFDNGITLWHNIEHYGDYSYNNGIVTRG